MYWVLSRQVYISSNLYKIVARSLAAFSILTPSCVFDFVTSISWISCSWCSTSCTARVVRVRWSRYWRVRSRYIRMSGWRLGPNGVPSATASRVSEGVNGADEKGFCRRLFPSTGINADRSVGLGIWGTGHAQMKEWGFSIAGGSQAFET